jgi:guanylate kinase
MFVKPRRLGIALIVSGPSGAGKSSVCADIKRIEPNLHFSVSCTTREPRTGERDGVDYHFISRDDFERKVRDGEFLEHAVVHGNMYGTLRSEVLNYVMKGSDVLLDIDVQGAMQIKEKAVRDPVLSKCVELVFIGPPSFKELENRLRNRATEPEEVIQLRLQNAMKEMEFWQRYDYLVINKDLASAVQDVHHLLDILHKRTSRLEDSGFF